MDKKPNVFPTGQQQQTNTPTGNEETAKVSVDSDYEAKRLQAANEIYSNSMNETGMSAVDAMKKRTEEQMRLRDEQLRKNLENTQNYQEQYDYAKQREPNPQAAPQPVQPVQQTQQFRQQEEQPQQKVMLSSEPKQIVNNLNMNTKDPYIEQLSQPQYNAAFDVIPLPSQGKLYKNKKTSVKVAYMTTADENILTSPNLLQSGEFLEILINRKLLETDIRYKDLHVGDRNAIMIWLRATSYGEMYPVTIFDEEDVPFDTEIDLTSLKTKTLNVEPDDEGYFSYMLPVSKAQIKFKLLSVGDIDIIEKLTEEEKKQNLPVSSTNTYTLERQIVEVNGSRDRNFIKDFIQTMRIKDAKELRTYINSIDCGIDLSIEVATPRGGSIKTFLPLNIKFFWPDFEV